MDLKIHFFDDCNPRFWNINISNLDRNHHFITWEVLKYYSAFNGIKNLSFLVEIEKKIVAAVPLATNKNKKRISFGFNYESCPCPSISKNITPSMRRKIIKEILKKIFILGKRKIKNINFFPIQYYLKKKELKIDSSDQFELVKFSKKNIIKNLLIIDLKKTKQTLFGNLSKYHKRNIKKSSEKNIKFNIYNLNSDKEVIIQKFNLFKKLHFKSAGRLTRPEKTWEIMLEQIFKDKADLFSLSINKGTDISFLYCGKINGFAWGWTQVNDDDFEREYMPRHTLEWKVILHYKKNKFFFYELGERLHASSDKDVTKKELSISEFKEKYGSESFPKPEFKIDLEQIN